MNNRYFLIHDKGSGLFDVQAIDCASDEDAHEIMLRWARDLTLAYDPDRPIRVHLARHMESLEVK
jgi:hypothetical protein